MRQSRHLGMNGMRQYYKELPVLQMNQVGRIIGSSYYPNVVAAGFNSETPPMGGPGGNVVAGFSSQTNQRSTLVIPIDWPAQSKKRINAIGFTLYIGALGYHGSDVKINWAVSDLNPEDPSVIAKFAWEIESSSLNDNECFLQGKLSIGIPEGWDIYRVIDNYVPFGCSISENNKIILENTFYTKNKQKFFNGNRKYLYLWDGAVNWGNNNIHLLSKQPPVKILLGYMGYSRIQD